MNHLVMTILAMLASSMSYSPPIQSRVPQRVVFIEPRTKVPVALVGTMHYNPVSVQLASSTVTELGAQNELFSVVVESCPGRWTKAAASQPQGSLMAKIFANEMRAAAEAAEVYNRPIILGDQDFNQTTSRIKQVFVQSLKDIATPLKGWRSLYSDLSTLGKTTLGGQGDDNFGPGDVFDPTLLAGAPTSILRYVLAILIKAPKVGIPVFSLFVYSVLQSVAEDLSAPIALTDMPGADVVSETLLTLGVNVLEVVLLGRVFLQALLLERNSILADNIYAECVKAKALPGKPKTVVAILGMAHCNGVKDLLSRPNE